MLPYYPAGFPRTAGRIEEEIIKYGIEID